MSERKSKYSPEFRADAVRLALSPGQTVRGTARDLGIHAVTLRSWITAARPPAPPPEPLTTDEREELKRLRRRVRTLEEEREILKTAAAFFARETDGTR